MSADNSVCILKTLKGDGFEYRVSECLGDFIFDVHDMSENKKLKHARKIWEKSKVHNNLDDALQEASEILKELCVCEYGICSVDIDREF